MAIKYSEKVKDHFMNPRNVGEIEDADGIGEVGNPACGDIMNFYIKVDDDKVTDVKFKTFGCGAAIAVSSMISEMAKGKSVDEALKITNMEVAESLEGLPQNKLHCSNLGADALQAAIRSYQNKKDNEATVPEKVVIDHDHEHDDVKEDSSCRCPHCEIDNPSDIPFCEACGKELNCSE